MEHHTYIIYSSQIDRYYIGYTSENIEERVRRHNTNHKGYTGRVNDWILVYKEKYETKGAAMSREREIKGMEI